MSEDKQLFDVSAAPPSRASRWFDAVLQRKKPIIIVLVLVVIVGGFSYAMLTGKLSSLGCKLRYNKTCALNEGAKLLDVSKTQELAKVVDKMKKLDDYQADADLLYMATVYYINVGDVQNATKSYEQLSKVYKPNIGYSEKLGTRTVLLSDMKQSIDFMNNQSKQFKSNIRYLTQPK